MRLTHMTLSALLYLFSLQTAMATESHETNASSEEVPITEAEREAACTAKVKEACLQKCEKSSLTDCVTACATNAQNECRWAGG